ncbi:MAG: ligase protein [Candidatus Amesbacteria bacterium GW2011_GWB1_47_26]|nr:MAG: ligase protein [Candidatus Amesbacteria bacterium GW2011_GWB1_47_26]
MKFAELARYLQKLEGTRSRNEMTVILAQLFGQANPEDARLIAYLSQGRLGPAYASPDTGVYLKKEVIWGSW